MLPDSRAARSPEALCVSDDDLSLNNSQFLAHVRAAAALLRGRGVAAGDVVAAMLPNRVEFVIALFSAWRLGATVTPINPNLTLTEAEYQLADSGAKLLISDIPGMRVDTIGARELCAAANPGTSHP
ncbi:AMP-binding protein [Prauserella oleivorans]